MARYRRSITIEAVRFTGEITKDIESIWTNPDVGYYLTSDGDLEVRWASKDGPLIAKVHRGNFLVKDGQDSLRECDSRYFLETYELCK